MNVEALPKAIDLWNSPAEMIKMWDDSDTKTHYEEVVRAFIGNNIGVVADLGCGVGRFADVLNYKSYLGYDFSQAMIRAAVLRREEELDVEFCNVDIFNFSSDTKYDVVTMIDVAHHQNEPVEAILRILELWDAKRYYFSLLVGDIREDLYNSTVVSFVTFLKLFDKAIIPNIIIKRDGGNEFAWVLIEVIK